MRSKLNPSEEFSKYLDTLGTGNTDMNELFRKSREYGMDLTPASISPARTQPTIVSPQELGQSDYDENFTPDYSDDYGLSDQLGEHRALNQPWYDKWGNASGKFLGLATQAFVETFVDLPVGMMQGVVEKAMGKEGRASVVYDNFISDYLKQGNEYLEKELLPNYYTREEAEKPFWENLDTPNFWADKFFKNLGFTAGAITAGIVSGNIGGAILGLSKYGRIAAGLAETEGALGTAINLASKGAKVSEALEAGAKSLKFRNALNVFQSTTASAIGEASMEAHQGKDDFIKLEVSKYKASHNNQDPPEEVLQDIESKADALGNVRFAANMAILMPSNFIQFGNAFGRGFLKDSKALNKIASATGESVDDVVSKDLLTTTFQAAKKPVIDKVLDKGWKVLKNPLSEGLYEEGGQYAVEKSVEDYYDRKYNKKIKGTVNDMIDSLFTGMKESYGSATGWEQIFIGALTGSLGMPGFKNVVNPETGKLERKGLTMYGGVWDAFKDEKAKDTEAAIGNLNNDKFNTIYENTVKALYNNAKYNKELAAGNHVDASTAKFNDFVDMVDTHNKLGTYDILIKKIEAAKNTDPETFAKLFGFEVQDIDKTQINQITNKLLEKAQSIKEISDAIDTKFRAISPDIRESLIRYGSNIKNIDRRTEELSNKIMKDSKAQLDIARFNQNVTRFFNSNLDYNTYVGQTTEDFVENIKNQFEEFKKNGTDPLANDTIAKDINDLIALHAQRQDYINIYNTLLTEEGQKTWNDKLEKLIKDNNQPEEGEVFDKFFKGLDQEYEDMLVEDSYGNKYKFETDPNDPKKFYLRKKDGSKIELTEDLITKRGFRLLNKQEADEYKSIEENKLQTAAQITSLQQMINERTAWWKDLKKQQKQLDDDLAYAQTVLETSKEYLGDNADKVIAAAQKTVDSYKALRDMLQEELDRVELEMRSINTKLNNIMQGIDTGIIQDPEESIDTLNKSLERLATMKGNLEDEIYFYNDEITKLEASIAKIRHIKDLTVQGRLSKVIKDQYKAEIKKLQKQLDDIKYDLTVAEYTLDNINKATKIDLFKTLAKEYNALNEKNLENLRNKNSKTPMDQRQTDPVGEVSNLSNTEVKDKFNTAKKASYFSTTGRQDTDIEEAGQGNERPIRLRSAIGRSKLPKPTAENPLYLKFYTPESAKAEYDKIFDAEDSANNNEDTIKSIVVDSNGNPILIDDNGNIGKGDNYIVNLHHNPKLGGGSINEDAVLAKYITKVLGIQANIAGIDTIKKNGNITLTVKDEEGNNVKVTYTYNELIDKALAWEKDNLTKFRANIISQIKEGKTVFTPVTSISNGHIQTMANDVTTGKPQTTSILKNFSGKSGITKVIVATKNIFQTIFNEFIPVKRGTVYIERQDGKIIPGITRTLNESEVQLVAELLHHAFNNPNIKNNNFKTHKGDTSINLFAQRGKLDHIIGRLINYGKADHRNKNFEFNSKYQIYFEDGRLYFGETDSISLNEIIIGNQINPELKAFLSTKTLHVNSTFLKKDAEYKYFHPKQLHVTPDGNVEVEYTSYSSDKNLNAYANFLITQEIITTNIVGSNTALHPQFLNVYLSFNDNLINEIVPTKTESKTTTPKVEPLPVKTKPKETVKPTTTFSIKDLQDVKDGEKVTYDFGTKSKFRTVFVFNKGKFEIESVTENGKEINAGKATLTRLEILNNIYEGTVVNDKSPEELLEDLKSIGTFNKVVNVAKEEDSNEGLPTSDATTEMFGIPKVKVRTKSNKGIKDTGSNTQSSSSEITEKDIIVPLENVVGEIPIEKSGLKRVFTLDKYFAEKLFKVFFPNHFYNKGFKYTEEEGFSKIKTIGQSKFQIALQSLFDYNILDIRKLGGFKNFLEFIKDTEALNKIKEIEPLISEWNSINTLIIRPDSVKIINKYIDINNKVLDILLPIINKYLNRIGLESLQKELKGFNTIEEYNKYIKLNPQHTLVKERSIKLANPNYTKANVEAERKWFEERFNIPFNVVKDLINNRALGEFRDVAVYLWENAEEGTTYHEAFHAAINLFLNKTQRNALFNEYRNRKGVDRDITDFDIEEALAEEFREYILSDGTLKIPSVQFEKKSLFEKLWDWIKKLFNKTYTIEEIYQNIQAGEFKKSIPFTNRMRIFFNKLKNKSIIKERQFNNYSETETKKFVEGLHSEVMDIILRNGDPDRFFEKNPNITLESLYGNPDKEDSPIANVISQIQDRGIDLEKLGRQYEANYLFEIVDNITDNYKDLIRLHIEHLRTLGISIKDDELIDQNSLDSSSKDENDGEQLRRNTSEYRNAIEFNTKDGAPKSMRLLVGSLKKYNPDGMPYLNEFGLPESEDYDKVYSLISNKLAGVPAEFPKMIAKLRELEPGRPYINRMANILEVGKDAGTFNQEALRTAFVTTFAKHNYQFQLMRIDANGNMFNIESSNMRLEDKIRKNWSTQFKQKLLSSGNIAKGEGVVITENYLKDLEVIKDSLDKVKNPTELSEKLTNAYAKLGITFSFEDIATMKVGGKDLHEVFNNIVTYLTVGTDIYAKDSGVSGSIDSLLKLEKDYIKDTVELQHINPEGKPVYNINLNTYCTVITSQINSIIEPLTTTSQRREALKAELPFLFNDAFATNSLVLKQVIEEGLPIKIDILEGVDDSSPGTRGIPTEKLDPTTKWSQLFNSTLEGKYHFIRQADRGVEFSYKLGKGSKFVEDIDGAVNIFKGYFKDEVLVAANLKLAIDNNQKDIYGANVQNLKDKALTLPMFSEIVTLSTEDINEIINNSGNLDEFLNNTILGKRVVSSIRQYLNNKVSETKAELLSNGVLEQLSGISKEHLNSIKDNKMNLSQKTDYLIEQFTYNSLIGYMEVFKIFMGNPAIYKNSVEIFKRASMFGSSKEITRVGTDYDNYLNSLYADKPRVDKKLADGKINTIILKDVEVGLTEGELTKLQLSLETKLGKNHPLISKYLKVYKSYEPTDGQGYITMDEYRELLLRSGKWTLDHEKVFNKIQQGKALSYSEIVYLQPLKTQYTGNLVDDSVEGLNILSGYKHSLMPLIPSIISGSRTLSELNNYMISNKLGIAQYNSGNKYGTLVNESGKINTVFNSDGTINTEGLVHQTIDYRYIGIQANTLNTPKEKNTRGTQFTTTIAANIVESKPLMDIYQKYVVTNNEIVNYLFDQIRDQLGISKVGDITSESARNNLVNFLLDAIKDRAVNDNIIESIQYLKDPEVLIDSLVNKNKIENIINSVTNNKVFKEKRKGGSRILVSSVGMSPISFNEDQKTSYSDYLKFYRTSKATGETLPFECEMALTDPIMIKYVANKYGNASDPTGLNAFNKLIEEDNKLYNEYHEGKREKPTYNIDEKLLTVVGYRIPSQIPSSFDYARIVKFLPSESGDAMIVPYAIVAKTGCDFDIDKWNMYSYNQTFSIDELSNEETLLSKIHKAIDTKYGKTQRTHELKKLLNSLDAIEDVLDEVDREGKYNVEDWKLLVYNVYQRDLESVKNVKTVESENISKDNELYKKSLENRLLDHTIAMLAHPEYLNNLITPVTNVSIKSYTDKIINLLGENDPIVKAYKNIGYSDLISPVTNMKKFFEFLSGKIGVAQTAIHITNHVKSQLANLYVEDAGHLVNWIDANKVTIDGKSKLSLGGIKNKAGEYIIDILSDFLSAYVDVAKDPYIYLINATTQTINTYYYLIRLGVHPEFVTKFMSQPIIKDFIKQQAIGESLVWESKDIDMKKEDYTNLVLNKYNPNGLKYNELVSYKKENNPINRQHKFTTPELTSMLGKDVSKMSPIERNNQQLILEQFLEMQQQAMAFQRMVTNSNSSSKGVGKNLEQTKVYIREKNKVLTEGFIGNLEKLYNLDTIEGTYTDKVQQHKDLIGDYFLIENKAIKESLDVFKDAIERLSRGAEKKAKARDYINNEFLTYLIMTQKNGIKFDNNVSLLFGSNTMANKIIDIQLSKLHPELSDNLLIQELVPIISTDPTKNNTVELFSRKINVTEANSLIQSFREIYEVDPTLAKDMAKFVILQSGLNKSPITWVDIIPSELYKELVTDVLSYANNHTETIDLNEFKDQFFRQNPSYNPTYKSLKSFSGLVMNDKMTSEELSQFKYIRSYDKQTKILSLKNIETKNTVDIIGNGFRGKAYGKTVSTKESNNSINKTINVYWGQPESETSIRILSNLAPRKFKYESTDGITREYGSVEHAYQSNKNGKFDKNTYDAYVSKGGYGVKISPKLKIQKVEEFEGFWTREQVAKQTDKIFLFGDNTDDRLNTKYIPSSTQAVIRGLPNAIGIDTKKDRGISTSSYLTNEDFDWFKNHVNSQIQKAKDSGKTIVIPADGIGTGKAMLKEKAPKLFEYLEQQLNSLKKDNLQLMKDLVVESFIQNPNSEAAEKLLQYENFTHNTNKLIDKAFLEGLQLARKELLKNNPLEKGCN